MSSFGQVPRFNVHDVAFKPLPGFGQQAILYTSADGTRLAGSFRESGSHSMVMPFDEFIYVIEGGCSISVEDGDSFELVPGDCCYLREGQNVSFDMTDDFHDVTVLISNTPFNIEKVDE